MNRAAKLLAFVAIFIVELVWILFFLHFIVPAIYPVFADRFWVIWLVVGVFIIPCEFPAIYVAIRITGSLWQFDRTQWKIALIGTPLGLMFLSALGYTFSYFIPPSFEPFRSITLPGLVLALVLIIIGRMKFIKKYQVTQKPTP